MIVAVDKSSHYIQGYAIIRDNWIGCITLVYALPRSQHVESYVNHKRICSESPLSVMLLILWWISLLIIWSLHVQKDTRLTQDFPFFLENQTCTSIAFLNQTTCPCSQDAQYSLYSYWVVKSTFLYTNVHCRTVK